MAQLTIERIADRVDRICDRNSSWREDFYTATTLFTLDGDWEAQVDWMAEAIMEDYNGTSLWFFEEGVKLAVTRQVGTLTDLDLTFCGRMDQTELFELAEAKLEEDTQFKVNFIIAAIENEYYEFVPQTAEMVKWALSQNLDEYDRNNLQSYLSELINEFEDEFTKEEVEAATEFVYNNGIGKATDDFKAQFDSSAPILETAELYRQLIFPHKKTGSTYTNKSSEKLAWTTYITSRLESETSPVGKKFKEATDADRFLFLFSAVQENGKWRYDASGNYFKA
jgi:hypothetical protein